MSSSDDSRYLDFSTPHKPDQIDKESDDYNWDSHEEELSFNNQPQSSPPPLQEQTLHPFVFGEDLEEPTTVWPPRQLSSEDFSQLEADPVPLNFLAFVPEEEVSDEVFRESDIDSEDQTTVEMPPKAQPPTPEELEVKFKRAVRNWSQNYARFTVPGAKILPNDVEDMRAKRDNLEELADDVFDAVEDEEAEIFTNTLASISDVRKNMSSLYESFEASRQPENANVNEVNPDQVIDKEIKKMKGFFIVLL